jgi:serine/threonine protein kinase
VNSDFEEVEVDAATEDLERYGLGLCYPICIGDVLIHKYRIEHKLGHDDFSTVWLVRDIKKKRDVVLKIMIPGDAGDYDAACRRIRLYI